MMEMASSSLMRFLKIAKRHMKKGKGPYLTTSALRREEEGNLIRLWNRLRQRTEVPNEALSSMEEMRRWAAAYEEKFSSSENPEEREAAKLYRAVKERAFYPKFFEASQKIVGIRAKTVVKSYSRKMKIIEKKFQGKQKSISKNIGKADVGFQHVVIEKPITVRAYVKSKPKRFTPVEKLKIAILKSKNERTKNIAAQFSNRTYSSIATAITRIRQQFGSWKNAVKVLSKQLKVKSIKL